ncbi:S26 family signal peptidase [Sphingomonas sp.]|uniref:S26 family signal peptidase n=1 Tax=Sphingomonas sp. TaxID=28214 RepID=UPI0031E3B110
MADPRDLPLFAQALRRDRRRRMLRRRGLAVALGVAALGLIIVAPPRPRLLWNASASVPIGLYRVGAAPAPAPGELVVAWLPGPARRLAAQRRYLPGNVPAIKRVAAVAGARICGIGATLTIDGRAVAHRLAADRLGRPLPRWEGCRTLRIGELLLLNPASPASFDGRYFGASRTSDVVGTAHPLWTWHAAETGA